METVTTDQNRLGHTYAEPLSGLRVSWGAVLAGAVALLAVSLVIWAACLAIVMTATHANADSIKGSLIALWICSIVTTLIGAYVGGSVAGYLPGNTSKAIASLHAFLAWGVAFLVTALFEFALVAEITQGVTQNAVTAVSAATQAAGATVGGVAAGAPNLADRAVGMLESLGYSTQDATRMVHDARSQLQSVLHGQTQRPSTEPVANAANAVLSCFAAVAWVWFGTWLLAGVLAILGGISVRRRLAPRERGERVVRVPSTATPAPAR
jgi:hypothetical protein